MRKPLVSIVTPCYNGKLYISRFLSSIIAQTYSHIELILIDDGSTDGTKDVIDSYLERFQNRGIPLIYEHQENAGQAAALNKGLKLFSGTYMLWMDSDDEISNDFIQERVEFLEIHTEFAFCYGRALCVSEDHPEKVVSVIGKRDTTGQYSFFEGVLYSKGIFFPGYMARTSAIDEVIKDREIFSGRGGQNAQLLLPLSWNYGEPGFVENSTYTYYLRENSHSHSKNTCEKIIRQYANYERILIETINRINDERANDYIGKVRHYYGRIRFGNAVDSRNGTLIRRQLRELRNLGIDTIHDYLMAIKYSLPLINHKM